LKNIAFLIDSLQGGGAEKVVLTLARDMSLLGHKVHLIVLKNKLDYQLDFDVQIHHFVATPKKGVLRPFYYQKQGKRLKSFIAEIEADSGKLDLLFSNLTESDRIASAADLPGTYFCIHCATSRQKLGDKKGISLFLRRRKYKKIYDGKHIIAVSDGVARDLLEEVGVRPRSIRTIYNPFDFDSIRALVEEGTVPYEGYIVNVASFKDVKRHDILLKAFAKSGLGCQLLLLGQGQNQGAINQLARELNIADQVVQVGFQANPYPWLKKAKLLVLSSDSEGLPMVIVEALACGTPVVSTDCPHGPREILRNGLSAGLVPVGDINALADRMRQFYEAALPLGPVDLDRFAVRNIAKQYLSLAKVA
jgi:glycosyltransferase involved in cell wall biosynthesis